jgi:plastocyanin
VQIRVRFSAGPILYCINFLKELKYSQIRKSFKADNLRLNVKKNGFAVWIVIIVVVFVIGILIGKGLNNPSKNTTSCNCPIQNCSENCQVDRSIPPQQKIVLETKYVYINGYTFKENNLSIQPGDTVIWINQDVTPHDIISDNGTELNSSALGLGQMYAHQFNYTGIYSYHCSFHPYMRGVVEVRN